MAITKAKINQTGKFIRSSDSLEIKTGAKRKLVLEERDQNKSLKESVLIKNFGCPNPDEILNNKKY